MWGSSPTVRRRAVVGATVVTVTGLLALRSQPLWAQSAPPACQLENENLEPLIDGDRRIQLPFRVPRLEETPTAVGAIASWLAAGLIAGRSSVTARISEARSGQRIKSRLPVFPELITPHGQRPDETFALVRLSVDRNSRVLIVGESSDSLFNGFRAEARLRENQQIPLRLEQTVEVCVIQGERATMYRGTPTQPLEPGEYAVFYGDNFYDFGVDP